MDRWLHGQRVCVQIQACIFAVIRLHSASGCHVAAAIERSIHTHTHVYALSFGHT